MKFGTNVDPIKKLSHTKNLAHFIGLRSSYGHSKFLHNFLFNLHFFNKRAITLFVINIDISGLIFLKFSLNSHLDDI